MTDDTCYWHPDTAASHQVRVYPPAGTVEWLWACGKCAGEFMPDDRRVL